MPPLNRSVALTEHQQYVTLLTCLSYEIARLELKLAALLRIRERAGQAQGDSVAPIFTMLAESLHIDVIMSLAKLFENRNDSRPRSLPRLISFLDSNCGKIQWDHQLTVFDSRRHRAQIEARRAEINLVTSQRDSYFAHHDKDYSGRLEDLTSDLPITNETLVALLQLAQQIIAKHSHALNSTESVDIAQLTAGPVDEMVTACEALMPDVDSLGIFPYVANPLSAES